MATETVKIITVGKGHSNRMHRAGKWICEGCSHAMTCMKISALGCKDYSAGLDFRSVSDLTAEEIAIAIHGERRRWPRGPQ